MFRALTSPSARFAFAPAVVAPLVVVAGLTLAGVGCTSDAPGTPEADKSTLQKVEDKASDLGKKAVEGTGKAVKATGNAIESAGQKLETSAAESVKENIGEKAGKVVESVGKGMEKAGESVGKGGDKLKDSVTPK